MAGRAWNDWYHLMANTYGTWLPGDERGFRTRGHREHIEGDYRNPPPAGRYENRKRRSQRLLDRAPVYLPPPARIIAVRSMVHSLTEVHAIELLALAINDVHVHALGRFPKSLRRTAQPTETGAHTSAINDAPRHYLGIAKQWSSKTLAVEGLISPGGAWAAKGKIKPIRDRQHQINVYRYIVAHIDQDAAVWSFHDRRIRTGF